MSDGGARQPRYGIRFKRTGQASGRTWRMARHAITAKGKTYDSLLCTGGLRGFIPGGENSSRTLAGYLQLVVRSHEVLTGGPAFSRPASPHNFLFGMVQFPPSGGTRWVII
ncbi:hypothetical protein B0H17DRAFT_1144490 [Mycena rosella]|uniref:Uncharacterized protein n=1 Tax=Mycena rosella TaxID=1033263 RepID=A0AAD7CTC2_MYCRO|nr:hypothetical protein B0H17DRAFT_1144490 [Mycena rosella]